MQEPLMRCPNGAALHSNLGLLSPILPWMWITQQSGCFRLQFWRNSQQAMLLVIENMVQGCKGFMQEGSSLANLQGITLWWLVGTMLEWPKVLPRSCIRLSCDRVKHDRLAWLWFWNAAHLNSNFDMCWPCRKQTSQVAYCISHRKYRSEVS